jgi:hypothetical protein
MPGTALTCGTLSSCHPQLYAGVANAGDDDGAAEAGKAAAAAAAQPQYPALPGDAAAPADAATVTPAAAPSATAGAKVAEDDDVSGAGGLASERSCLMQGWDVLGQGQPRVTMDACGQAWPRALVARLLQPTSRRWPRALRPALGTTMHPP